MTCINRLQFYFTGYYAYINIFTVVHKYVEITWYLASYFDLRLAGNFANPTDNVLGIQTSAVYRFLACDLNHFAKCSCCFTFASFFFTQPYVCSSYNVFLKCKFRNVIHIIIFFLIQCLNKTLYARYISLEKLMIHFKCI